MVFLWKYLSPYAPRFLGSSISPSFSDHGGVLGSQVIDQGLEI